jgi:hypothetical protein
MLILRPIIAGNRSCRFLRLFTRPSNSAVEMTMIMILISIPRNQYPRRQSEVIKFRLRENSWRYVIFFLIHIILLISAPEISVPSACLHLYLFSPTILNPSKGWYRAAHAQARIARQISKQFWKPVVEADGIPIDTLMTLMQSLYGWKDQYLAKVGVPSNFQAEWDFMSAISACPITPPAIANPVF